MERVNIELTRVSNGYVVGVTFPDDAQFNRYWIAPTDTDMKKIVSGSILNFINIPDEEQDVDVSETQVEAPLYKKRRIPKTMPKARQ